MGKKNSSQSIHSVNSQLTFQSNSVNSHSVNSHSVNSHSVNSHSVNSQLSSVASQTGHDQHITIVDNNDCSSLLPSIANTFQQNESNYNDNDKSWLQVIIIIKQLMDTILLNIAELKAAQPLIQLQSTPQNQNTQLSTYRITLFKTYISSIFEKHYSNYLLLHSSLELQAQLAQQQFSIQQQQFSIQQSSVQQQLSIQRSSNLRLALALSYYQKITKELGTKYKDLKVENEELKVENEELCANQIAVNGSDLEVRHINKLKEYGINLLENENDNQIKKAGKRLIGFVLGYSQCVGESLEELNALAGYASVAMYSRLFCETICNYVLTNKSSEMLYDSLGEIERKKLKFRYPFPMDEMHEIRIMTSDEMLHDKGCNQNDEGFLSDNKRKQIFEYVYKIAEWFIAILDS